MSSSSTNNNNNNNNHNHNHIRQHHHHILPTSSSPSSPTTTKGHGNTQACAACKYQRRKCAPDCILAPYFPHDRQRQFLNAHKLFGVSNITKIIKHLDQPDKDEAMRTIIFQSDVRANDPVGGCYRIIRELQRLIEYNKAELDIVLHQLAICRANQQIQITEITDAGDQNSCDQLINVDPLSLYGNSMSHYHYIQPHHEPQEQQPQQQYVVVQNNNSNNNNLHEDVSMWAMQDSMSSLEIKHANDCEDLKPFVDEMNNNVCDHDDQRNGEVRFGAEDNNIADHQQSFVVPNTELLISS